MEKVSFFQALEALWPVLTPLCAATGALLIDWVTLKRDVKRINKILSEENILEWNLEKSKAHTVLEEVVKRLDQTAEHFREHRRHYYKTRDRIWDGLEDIRITLARNGINGDFMSKLADQLRHIKKESKQHDVDDED